MSDDFKNEQNDNNASFDRQAYLKEIREGLLKKLGLPEDTRPENVAKLLEIKSGLGKIKS